MELRCLGEVRDHRVSDPYGTPAAIATASLFSWE
jgi:hypothetical protein